MSQFRQTDEEKQHFPRLGVSILVKDNQKLLLVKRAKEPLIDHWAFPGGGVAFGERLEAAAHRELYEETSLCARKLNFLGFTDRITKDRNGKIVHHFVLARFYCDEFEGDLQAGDDAKEARFVSAIEADGMELVPGLSDLITEALTER